MQLYIPVNFISKKLMFDFEKKFFDKLAMKREFLSCCSWSWSLTPLTL